MCFMTSAFCGADLKTGTLIVGWVKLFPCIVATLVVSVIVASMDKELTRHLHISEGRLLLATCGTFYGIMILVICSLGCLIHGAMKDRRGFLMPYLVLFGLLNFIDVILILLVVVAIIFGKIDAHSLDKYRIPVGLIIVPLISFAIDMYFFCVVRSRYVELIPDKDLESESNKKVTFIEEPLPKDDRVEYPSTSTGICTNFED